MTLELTNANGNGFLSSINTKWNYTFPIDFDVEAKNVNEFVEKINSIKDRLQKYHSNNEIGIHSISGTVNDKPMSKASHPCLDFNKFLEEYK